MSEQPTFEERMATLERIVRELEDGEAGLETAVGRYQEGVRLLKDLQAEIDRLERKIELLAEDGSLSAFEDEEESR